MKYRVEIGSFCTRLVTRKITVSAENEAEASEKAIYKFIDMEMKVSSSVDHGCPHVDFVDIIRI